MASLRLLLLPLPFLLLAVTGCSAGSPEDTSASSDELAESANAEWIYDGPLTSLERPVVTVALDGHTVRISGLLPKGFHLASTPPHVRLAHLPSGRVALDAVYPIATADPALGANARAGSYRMYDVIPFRPNDPVAGEGWVTWGGFPFLRYDAGIALHGPITAVDDKAPGDDLRVWYLRRGAVSHGCNRMLGEHVVELAHLAGVDMRRAWTAERMVDPPHDVKVVVVDGYDRYDGKWIDVDYPTDAGAVRPAAKYGAGNVVMFGSWVASTMPNGRDLPPDVRWEGGRPGEWYTFADHAKRHWVCAVTPAHHAALESWTNAHGDVPRGFCAHERCFVNHLRGDPARACGL